MDILTQLIRLMLEKVEIKPVVQKELDGFLAKQNIKICDEYYKFLLNYGNSTFLKIGYADLTFSNLKAKYLENGFLEEILLPPNCFYIGRDFIGEPLCIDNDDKKIYLFGDCEKDLLYYGGINEFLFYCLFQAIDLQKIFDKVATNIKIIDIENFKNQYLNYEVKNIYRYNHYFFKANELIICDEKFSSYHHFTGGILEQAIKAR